MGDEQKPKREYTEEERREAIVRAWDILLDWIISTPEFAAWQEKREAERREKEESDNE